MPVKKDFIYYINSTDKLLKNKLEQINFLDEQENTKELSNQKLVEDITNNVIKALSKNIESIVSEQISKMSNTRDEVKAVENNDISNITDMVSRTEKLVKKLDSLGVKSEYKYNIDTGNVDLVVIDSTGKRYVIDYNKAKGFNFKEDNQIKINEDLVEKYIANRAIFNNYNSLFAGAGGLQNVYNPIVNDTSPDFTNYKVKSNIGYFMDKLNMQRTWLANQTSVSRGTIVANLEEANGLSLLNAYKISKVLGVPMEELFVFTDEDDEETDRIE